MTVELYAANSPEAQALKAFTGSEIEPEVRITHYRQYAHPLALFPYQLPKSKGGFTLAYTIDEVAHKSCSITFAIAFCSSEDNFVKQVGTELATKRLLEDGPTYQTDLDVGSDAIVVMVDRNPETQEVGKAWYEFSNSALLRRAIAQHCIAVATYMMQQGEIHALDPEDADAYDEEETADAEDSATEADRRYNEANTEETVK